MLHAAAAFRLRRRTVKQRKSKSRSQGDKYRPTVHTEHRTVVFAVRPAHESKEGSLSLSLSRVYTLTRAKRKPFPVDIVAKRGSAPSLPSCLSERKLSAGSRARRRIHKIRRCIKYYQASRMCLDACTIIYNARSIYSTFINSYRAIVI